MSLPNPGRPGDFPGGARNPRAAANAKLGKLHEIQGVMRTLRAPVDAPDLSSAILSRVEAERPFTDLSERRWVWAGRVSVAAGILMLLGAVFVLHSVAPKTTTWAGRSAPLSAVIDNAEIEVVEGFHTIRAQIASVGSMVPSVEVPGVECRPAGESGCVGGCWASPLLTVSTPSAGLSEAGVAAVDGVAGTGRSFVRYKAEFLHDRYLAAKALEAKPVGPPAPH